MTSRRIGKFLVVAATAPLTALLLPAPPASSTFPGKNGLLLYWDEGPTGDGRLRGHLWLANSDGSYAKRLTKDDRNVDSSVWSPDGRKVAFLLEGKIGIVNVDGSGFRMVTNDKDNRRDYLEFSPDGTQLAFTKVGPSPEFLSNIFVMNIDGTDDHALTTEGFYRGPLSWSPTGELIAYLNQTEGEGGIETLNLATGERQVLSGRVRYPIYPDFSPDGSKVVFAHSDSGQTRVIRYVNSDGSNPKIVLIAKEGQVAVPNWTPDGKKILYSYQYNGRIKYDDSYRIVNIDGSGKKMISDELVGASMQPCHEESGCRITTRQPTDLTVGYNRKSDTKLDVFGQVYPLHPGERVTVRLYRKVDGKFQLLDTHKAVLVTQDLQAFGYKNYGYNTTFDHGTGRTNDCKVTSSFSGDRDHKGAKASDVFRCS